MTNYEIQELRNKRLDIWNEAKKLLDSHTDKNGQISNEVVEEYMRLEKKVRELDNAISLHEHKNGREVEYNKLIAEYTPIENYTGGRTKISGGIDGGGMEYKNTMVQAMRSGFSDRSITNQLMTSNSGGYLLDVEMNDEIITKLQERNVLREISHVIQTATEHKVPILTNAPKSVWVEEGGQINFATDTSYSSITLGAYKLACSCKVTNELLFDSAYNLWEHVENIFVESISQSEQDAMINGRGITRPTGIISRISADTAMQVMTLSTTLLADDVISLIYELPREYRQNASFLMNDTTAAVLRKLKTVDQEYIWQQNFSAGEPETLCGYRVYTSPYMPSIASGNIPIIFGDFNYFYIADRGTRTMRELKELFAANDLTGFLMVERLRGS